MMVERRSGWGRLAIFALAVVVLARWTDLLSDTNELWVPRSLLAPIARPCKRTTAIAIIVAVLVAIAFWHALF